MLLLPSFSTASTRAEVMGEQTPPSSRVEMEQIATKLGVQKRVLATGSLGIHEENPTAVAEVILPFLRAQVES